MDTPTLYSELYKLGQDVIRTNNPCKFKDGKCMEGYGCCGGCKHLGPNGCTVEALSCKLWLCGTVMQTPDGARAQQQLLVIKRIAYEHKVPLYLRSSKEETFTEVRIQPNV